MFNNYLDPHSLSDKFEDVFVYDSHVNPSQSRGAEFPAQLLSMQRATVVLDRGLNINFGEALEHCMTYKPVIFSPYRGGNISSPVTTARCHSRIVTHNTGVRPLQRNEAFTVVPPMCDCPDNYKIKNVIPLQTVSHTKYSAALNQFFDWMKGVNYIRSLITENSNPKIFSLTLDMAYDQIKNNYLVRDMMEHISVPDGNQITKINTLYDIVNEHWMKPIFGQTGILAEGVNIPTMIETSLRAINDINPEYKALLRHTDIELLNDRVTEMLKAKLKAMVVNILKIVDYYKMLVKYMLPLELPINGTVCVSYDDQFFVYPGKKMEIKQT